jgi:multisite-specific tRNA:(cytosine-C5)-methyltransferase
VLFFEDEAVIESLISFFGIKESFPLRGHLVTRSIQANNTRRIYYISKSVQEILQLNLEVGEQLKIASLGFRIFVSAPMRKTITDCILLEFREVYIFHWTISYSDTSLFQETHRSKDECSCAYRLSYEGLPLLLRYVSKRLLYASPVDFHRLLQYRTIKFAHFVDTRLGEEAADLTPGCCVVVLHEGNGMPLKTKIDHWLEDNVNFRNISGHKNEDSLSMDPSTIAMVCWRGKGTMNVMLSSPDRKDLLEMMECQFRPNGAKVENEKPCHKIDELDQRRWLRLITKNNLAGSQAGHSAEFLLDGCRKPFLSHPTNIVWSIL